VANVDYTQNELQHSDDIFIFQAQLSQNGKHRIICGISKAAKVYAGFKNCLKWRYLREQEVKLTLHLDHDSDVP